MTTRIKVLQQMSGYRNGEPWPGVGEFMEVSDEEAASLTSGQTPIAEVAEPEPEPERQLDTGDDGEQDTEPPVNAPNGGKAGPANASAAGPAKPRMPAKPRGAATAKR